MSRKSLYWIFSIPFPTSNPFSSLTSLCSSGSCSYGLSTHSSICEWSNNLLSKPGHFWARTMEVDKLSWASQGSWLCWGLVPALQRAKAPARQTSPCAAAPLGSSPTPCPCPSGPGVVMASHLGPRNCTVPLVSLDPAHVLGKSFCLKFPPCSAAMGHLLPACTLPTQKSR